MAMTDKSLLSYLSSQFWKKVLRLHRGGKGMHASCARRLNLANFLSPHLMSHTQESGFGPGEARTMQTATPNRSLEWTSARTLEGKAMFGVSILKPDLNRKPSYDSAKAEVGKYFRFNCTCGTSIEFDLPSYIGNYQDRETILGAENSEKIRVHFELRHDRSLINGWPKFRIETCTNCKEHYLVYVAVFEPANGWFKIVPQGITQLLPFNNSIQGIASKLAPPDLKR